MLDGQIWLRRTDPTAPELHPHADLHAPLSTGEAVCGRPVPSRLSGPTPPSRAHQPHPGAVDRRILQSGFVGLRELNGRALLLQLDSYLQRVVDRDFRELGHTPRDSDGLRRWTSQRPQRSRIREASTAGSAAARLSSRTERSSNGYSCSTWVLEWCLGGSASWPSWFRDGCQPGTSERLEQCSEERAVGRDYWTWRLAGEEVLGGGVQQPRSECVTLFGPCLRTSR